jgi:hypothetical protein
MLFNCKSDDMFINANHEWLPIRITNKIDKYLGLPTYVDRSKREVSNFLAT